MIRTRKRPVLGRVTDVFGGEFNVLEIRKTNHGFDLLFGKPANPVGYEKNGCPGLIATQALADFWHLNRTAPQSVRFDLPVGTRTISRVRSLLGFNYSRDVTEFWKSRIDELATLSAREFAARYGVGRGRVLEVRKELLGRTQRENGWWRKPEILAIIQSNIKPRELSQKLGVSIHEAYRFRNLLRREARQATSVPSQPQDTPEAA